MKRLAHPVLVALLLQAALAGQAVSVDPALPEYTAVQGVSGTLKTVGSDTMNNEMALWAEDFQRLYPSVRIESEGKGSSTAPPALVKGTAHFGAMSRDMKAEEIEDFEKAFGYEPTVLPTSLDMLGVYVNKDNPLAGLTLQQVDAIFSKSRKGGAAREVRTWGDLGLTGEWADRPVSLYGRNAASGTYGYFKEHALFKGDFKDEVKELPGSSAVVQAVASDRYGIGYSGIGYRTADVRLVPLASAPGEAFVEAAPENAYSGEYPLARYLLLCVNRKPGTALDPLRREFVRYVLSRQGQVQVVKDGYLPLPVPVAAEALRKAGIDAAPGE